MRDAFSRRVVAWETPARADADLVLTTLEYDFASREVEPGKLIHHADHGCQYTFVKLTTRRVWARVQASMGSVGDSYDNSLAENLWMLHAGGTSVRSVGEGWLRRPGRHPAPPAVLSGCPWQCLGATDSVPARR
ncbi:DDE-type integrase/transposase/recombinase [Streptomyces sp. NPDC058534]|uniref:DDE-type integrase/transposase/recombinase n=1 Tax=Streptomyces sp. NPDC058534 TaxID=3346541 RepID=UPI0036501C84